GAGVPAALGIGRGTGVGLAVPALGGTVEGAGGVGFPATGAAGVVPAESDIGGIWFSRPARFGLEGSHVRMARYPRPHLLSAQVDPSSKYGSGSLRVLAQPLR